MKGRMVVILAVLALLAAPAAAPAATKAQKKSAIELTSISEVEVVVKNVKGEKEVKRQEAAKAKVGPGDTVIFTTRYANTSKQPVSNVTIMNPVPEHMLYLGKSAEGKGARIDFSVDGGKTYDAPGKLLITGKDGRVRPARAQEYTHIRWVLKRPLAPGGSGSVSFRAKLE